MTRPPHLLTERGGALLPTPRAQNGEERNSRVWARPMNEPQNLENALAHTAEAWGRYASAIDRWSDIIGRSAPTPTIDGRLNPELVEWMMGYEKGWVTDVDISRNAQLRCLGNAIVPLQAATAWAHLLGFDVTPSERERELLPTPTRSDSHGAGVHGRGGLDLRTTIQCL